MQRFKLSVLACYAVLAPLLAWLIVYSYFPHPLYARAYFLNTQNITLDMAEKVAHEDFAKGKRQIILAGSIDFNIVNHLRDSILLAEYQLEILYIGCVGPSPEAEHYSKTMLKQMNKHYGHNVYQYALEKARTILQEAH
jgi:hypothetical protein